jgi:hypothetical protein
MLSSDKNALTQDATLSTVLEGRAVKVHLSKAAQRALADRASPLLAEMELYFSCLIRLRVNFSDGNKQDAVPVSDKLAIRFHPVVGRRCDLHSVEGEQPKDDFQLVRRLPFVPHWLQIDYRKGEWIGKFGYRSVSA